MEEKIRELRAQMEARLSQIDSRDKLSAFWQDYLGKKGIIAELMKGLGGLSKEERPAMGKVINEFKMLVEQRYRESSERMERKEMEIRNRMEQVDITMPATRWKTGNLHPITIVMNEMIDVFLGMGFKVFDSPEIEDDSHNFTRLNVPKDHPARDMQDTFYISDEYLLRTHTSPGQIRVMDMEKPPIKVLVPGRVFRSDSDATHSPMFHQMEGLVVDKDVNMADLRGTLNAFAEQIYGKGITTRFRPSFFPFTEPSTEVDLTCSSCHGKGCRICKGTGWIEVLGAGMVNPRVLEMCGIDSSVYSGFAFGIGLERIAMLRYGISDMRLLYEGDVRFLSQFR